MNLQPMDKAPKTGRKIILKYKTKHGYQYTLASWKQPYSILSPNGAWKYISEDSVYHITENSGEALGWIEEPKEVK